MFRVYFNPSSGAHTAVTTASGICHTVAAICRNRGRVGTGLSVLWVAYARLKMEPTQSSETSAFNTQTPGKYPEDNLSLLQHGESLKTRNTYNIFIKILYMFRALPCSSSGDLRRKCNLWYRHFPQVTVLCTG
jgi:hypothetical protein